MSGHGISRFHERFLGLVTHEDEWPNVLCSFCQLTEVERGRVFDLGGFISGWVTSDVINKL